MRIKNIGKVDGKETAQVYISDANSSVARAVKELQGFTKVTLQAGEVKTVEVTFNRAALSFYEHENMHWIAEKGVFGVHVGASLVDIRLEGEVELEKTFTWVGL